MRYHIFILLIFLNFHVLHKSKAIYFISLVGTDASDKYGKGRPRKALSIFDIKSEMEFEKTRGIIFLSVQDLLSFYEEQNGESGKNLNSYQLMVFFLEKNPDGLYFLDEVPLIKGGGS